MVVNVTSIVALPEIRMPAPVEAVFSAIVLLRMTRLPAVEIPPPLVCATLPEIVLDIDPVVVDFEFKIEFFQHLVGIVHPASKYVVEQGLRQIQQWMVFPGEGRVKHIEFSMFQIDEDVAVMGITVTRNHGSLCWFE